MHNWAGKGKRTDWLKNWPTTLHWATKCSYAKEHGAKEHLGWILKNAPACGKNATLLWVSQHAARSTQLSRKQSWLQECTALIVVYT